MSDHRVDRRIGRELRNEVLVISRRERALVFSRVAQERCSIMTGGVKHAFLQGHSGSNDQVFSLSKFCS